MFYIIYKTTNTINNKFYIGKHQTTNLDDGYLGSGKLLKRAIEKYGKDNFIREILHVFDNEQDMNNKEKELVVVSEDTYNLCEGGQGGFGYINRNGLADFSKGGKRCTEIYKSELSSWGKKGAKSRFLKHGLHPNFLNSSGMRGKKVSEETKQKLRKPKKDGHQQGSNNNQFGTMWITNGLENKKIKKEDTIPDGWNKGRIMPL